MDSPQALLDQIHATGIYALDARELTETEDRVQKVKQIRPEIMAIRVRIQAAKKAIQSKRTRAARSQLVPYDYLEEILDKLEVALREFVTDPSVKMPVYGTVFFGNFEQGEWYLGFPRQAQIWKLEGQEKVLEEQLARLQPVQEDTSTKFKAARRAFNAHTGIIRRLFWVVLGLVCIGVGLAAALKTEVTLWLLISAAGAVFLLVGGVASLLWNRKHGQLRAQSHRLQELNERLTRQIGTLDRQQMKIASRLQQLRKPPTSESDDLPTHMHF